ncbi:MAG: GNAT family N-acetyltransferase [Planctomycetota bacterium]
MTLRIIAQNQAVGVDARESDLGVSYDVRSIRPSDLCGLIADRWQAIRVSNPRYSSPYFDLEFTKAVARIRDDVEIAVVRQLNDSGERIVGFLPFQRTRPRHGEPIGGRLNDVHGILSNGIDNELIMKKILKSVGLSSFSFHAALPPPSTEVQPFEYRRIESHYIDLSDGWDAYRNWIRKHSSTVKRHGQKSRKLEREIGPIRLEFDCQSASVMEELIELKRQKYQRTRTFDILSVDWARNLLHEIAETDVPNFRGILSVLWAGDELVGGHFGILTDHQIHYWFPTFDAKFSKYSPGTELILRICEYADTAGIKKIDFGYGDDPYKFKFCNKRETLTCGRFGNSEIRNQIARQRYFFRNQLKSIPMKPLAKRILRACFPGFGGWNFK